MKEKAEEKKTADRRQETEGAKPEEEKTGDGSQKVGVLEGVVIRQGGKVVASPVSDNYHVSPAPGAKIADVQGRLKQIRAAFPKCIFTWVASVIAILLCMGWPAIAADAVQPSSVTFTNTRSESAQSITWAGMVYQGSQLLLTNCVCLISTSNPQGLDSVTVDLSYGTLASHTLTTGHVHMAADGLWSATVIVPSNDFEVVVRITDVNTNRYIYPTKQFVTHQSMF